MAIDFNTVSDSKCDECDKDIDDAESCYCMECFDARGDKIEDLCVKKEALEERVKELETQLSEFQNVQEKTQNS